MIDSFKKALPDILWRHRWDDYRQRFGVPYTKGTMQNVDSAGLGPTQFKLGNRTYYHKSDYLNWLAHKLAEHSSNATIATNR